MLSTFLIWFREVMEIAIILGIIMAATRGVPSRNYWVGLGIVGGLSGSAVVAFFADGISNWMEGMGQEAFNALILWGAVLMITWTVVWMKKHGREIAQKMKQVGQAVSDGRLPLYSVAVVVSLSMWREGAEIVLFMTGILSTTKESLLAIIAGGAAGFALAAALGVMLYFGLIKLSTRYLFSVTSWLLVLLACGMAAQATGYLVAADLVAPIVPMLWDTSRLLSEDSLAGKILHSMIGYTARPSGAQAVAYIATFVAISFLLELTRDSAKPKERLRNAAGVAAAGALLTGALLASASHA